MNGVDDSSGVGDLVWPRGAKHPAISCTAAGRGFNKPTAECEPDCDLLPRPSVTEIPKRETLRGEERKEGRAPGKASAPEPSPAKVSRREGDEGGGGERMGRVETWKARAIGRQGRGGGGQDEGLVTSAAVVSTIRLGSPPTVEAGTSETVPHAQGDPWLPHPLMPPLLRFLTSSRWRRRKR